MSAAVEKSTRDAGGVGSAIAPSFAAKLRERVGVVFYNDWITHIPSHNVRIGMLRLFGANIGKHVSILRGTTVLGIGALRIGDAVDIGFRCLLDARGGLTIGSNVVIASDVQFIAGHHLPNSDTFEWEMMPTVVEDYAWIASRATVLPGVTIGRGAVVGACSLVRKDVAAMEMVAGVPAIHRGVRESALNYHPDHRPLFF